MNTAISINSVQNSIQQVVVVDKNTDFAANVIPGRRGRSIKRKERLNKDVFKGIETPSHEHS